MKINKTKKITIAVLGILIAGGTIFYACKKDNTIFQDTSSEVTTNNSKSIHVGQLHNEILEAYLVALEANPEINSMDFITDYLGLDKERFNAFVEGLTAELSKYSSMNEWYDDLEAKGVYSSDCINALRDIESFCLLELQPVSRIHEFKNGIFENYNFENEQETDLIVGALSILEYSTQYWMDEDRLSRWEIHRHYNPSTGEFASGYPCGTFDQLIGELYFWHLMSSIGIFRSPISMDLRGFIAAYGYATCFNENLEDNMMSLAYRDVGGWATGISSMASGW